MQFKINSALYHWCVLRQIADKGIHVMARNETKQQKITENLTKTTLHHGN